MAGLLAAVGLPQQVVMWILVPLLLVFVDTLLLGAMV